MKRAYSPKEIAAKKWVTLPWDEKWSKPFGFPAENASWVHQRCQCQWEKQLCDATWKGTVQLWDGAVHELRRENQPKLPTAYGLSEDE